jgi:hypothetical protein
MPARTWLRAALIALPISTVAPMRIKVSLGLSIWYRLSFFGESGIVRRSKCDLVAKRRGHWQNPRPVKPR